MKTLPICVRSEMKGKNDNDAYPANRNKLTVVTNLKKKK